MDTIFMKSESSKTSEPHVLILKLNDKLDLRRGEKKCCFSKPYYSLCIENIKGLYNNNKFKISAPAWNDQFELPNGSYSLADIQDCFEYVLKKHIEKIDNPSIRIYVNKIENRITLTIKTGHYLQLLTPKTMKLLGTLKIK